VNQLVVRKLLESEGILADVANNGQEVLEMYKNSIETGSPVYSVILMDIQVRN
jgi:CheY-like chemotaxis protein